MIEKNDIPMNRPFKAILVRTHKANEKESYRESPSLLREHPSCEQSVSGNVMDGKGHSDEVSDGNEEHVTGNERKGDPCFKAASSFTELDSPLGVLWKAELVSDKTGYLAEEISKAA